MALGTKNRLTQAATLCKQHLRESHADQLALVNEFIAEIEGDDRDAAKWSSFADVKRSDKAMLDNAEQAFQSWLNP